MVKDVGDSLSQEGNNKIVTTKTIQVLSKVFPLEQQEQIKTTDQVQMDMSLVQHVTKCKSIYHKHSGTA